MENFQPQNPDLSTLSGLKRPLMGITMLVGMNNTRLKRKIVIILDFRNNFFPIKSCTKTHSICFFKPKQRDTVYFLVFLCLAEPLRQLDSRLGPAQQGDLAATKRKSYKQPPGKHLRAHL